MKYFFTTQLGNTRYQTSDGAMLCKDVPIARTGTQTYLPDEIDLEADGSGTVTVYRTEDEVFSPETMASFEGVAVTLGHPEDDDGEIIFVNPSNFAELAHGHIQNVRRGTGDKSDLLLADVMVKRQEAIDAVESGFTDVSCGYDAKYKQISPGKGLQYLITGNHLAIVDKGRAGGRCAIGDSAPKLKTGKAMKKPLLTRIVDAIRTRDDDALAQLAKETQEMGSDGMSSIPGVTINMNAPAQATALPAEQRTTIDEGAGPEKDKPTGDDDTAPAWAQEIITLLKGMCSKTTDADPDDKTPTDDADAEEDAKVTGDAAYKRNIISDAEIIAPGFQPSGDKGLKRQVLTHAARTGDSMKAFGIADFSKASKATVDAVFTAAAAMNKAKNHITPPMRTTDSATTIRITTPAQINQAAAELWKSKK